MSYGRVGLHNEYLGMDLHIDHLDAAVVLPQLLGSGMKFIAAVELDDGAVVGEKGGVAIGDDLDLPEMVQVHVLSHFVLHAADHLVPVFILFSITFTSMNMS